MASMLLVPSVAQVSEIMDPEAGHVHRDGVVLACEVLECCPWFEFADLDVYGNTTEEEADDISTDPDELLELGMHVFMIFIHSALADSALVAPQAYAGTRDLAKELHGASKCFMCVCQLAVTAAENGDPIPSEADEELFHSLLAKAGMHLANAEGDESLVHLDADALQVMACGHMHLIVKVKAHLVVTGPVLSYLQDLTVLQMAASLLC